MGLFFKEKTESKNGTNQYLEDQQALFATKGEHIEKKPEEGYDQYVIKKKDYSDVPKYKAFDEKYVEVVIDKEQLGYQELNPEVQTVEIEKKDLYEDLREIVNNAPIDENTKENNKSIYDDSLKEEIKVSDEIDVIDVGDTEVVVAEVVEENIEKDKKLSIFGTSDEPVQAKIYEVKEAPIIEKIEILDVEPKEEEKEIKPEIKINENGNKICPQCGAPLAPNAPVCFLCGNKF